MCSGLPGQSWYSLVFLALLIALLYTLQSLDEKYYGHPFVSNMQITEALIFLNGPNA